MRATIDVILKVFEKNGIEEQQEIEQIPVSDGPYITTYEYDELYQLTRENNQKAGKTWAYTYDKSGNILSKAEYAYTTEGVSLGTAFDTITYTYSNENWGDQLTSYDGTTITYDAQGNPFNWRDGTSFSWTGRTLDSITKSDGTVVSFTYDANGMRTEKTVGDAWGNLISYTGTSYLAEYNSLRYRGYAYDNETGL